MIGLTVDLKTHNHKVAQYVWCERAIGWKLRKMAIPFTGGFTGRRWYIRISASSSSAPEDIFNAHLIKYLAAEYQHLVEENTFTDMTIVFEFHWKHLGQLECHHMWCWTPERPVLWNGFCTIAYYCKPTSGLHLPLDDSLALYNIFTHIPVTCKLSFNHINDLCACVSILLKHAHEYRRVQLITTTNTPQLSKHVQIVNLNHSMFTSHSPPDNIPTFFDYCNFVKGLPPVPPPLTVSCEFSDGRIVMAHDLTLTRLSDNQEYVIQPRCLPFTTNPGMFPCTLYAGVIVRLQEYRTAKYWVLVAILSNEQCCFFDWKTFRMYPIQSMESHNNGMFTRYYSRTSINDASTMETTFDVTTELIQVEVKVITVL